MKLSYKDWIQIFLINRDEGLLSADEVITSTKFGSSETPLDVVASTVKRYFLFGNKPVTILLSS